MDDFDLFVKKIKDYTAIDLAQYKEAQMKRRLTTLLVKKGYSTFASFFEAIRADRKLLDEFLDRMTINVSEFWRNPNRWEVLERTFLPGMIRQNARLKIWSAACSTGEEPYTLAMILSGLGVLGSTTLLATDLDDGALEKARKGIYADRSIREVPPRYLREFFREDGMTYAVTDSLRRAVRFQKGNLLTDPFEQGFDLIVCRNVMIYFTEEAKHQLYHKFAESLRSGGVLFVGSTEQIFSPGQYGLESAETFFYRKK